MDHGAKVNPIDTWGNTRLDCTTSAEVKNMLLKKGAKDTEKDNISDKDLKLII